MGGRGCRVEMSAPLLDAQGKQRLDWDPSMRGSSGGVRDAEMLKDRSTSESTGCCQVTGLKGPWTSRSREN